jgi:tryptophan synthase beta chain
MNKRILLNESEIPTHYLNINYYLNKYLGKLPDPPLHPGTKQPIKPEDLQAIFPVELIKQEVTLEEKVVIPDEVKEIYNTYRATPIIRAKRLEKYLDTPAHIYFKYEGETLSQSHKINTALAQAYFNKKEGVKTLTTETGAGQWGSALSIACRIFDLNCQVFMVRISFMQKPYRKYIMQLYGADIVSSPSNQTVFGKSVLEKDPDSPGSLGIAIGEALEITLKNKETKYALGSVLNHVLLHQTIVGQEAKRQMEKIGEYPDILIGCVGGGSNFGGFAIPFLVDKISGKKRALRAIGVEAASCPKMTKGNYRYGFGDTSKKTPLLKMETLGSDFVPPAIHAGGLRYHGNAPILSFLNRQGITEARAYEQKEVFRAAVDFARCEGLVSAPETAHAIKGAIDEAIRCKKEGVKKIILFNYSGNGLLDLTGYSDYMNGKLN